MEKMLHPAPQRLHQLAGAGQGEADHVDDDIGLERGDGGAELARGLGGLTVEGDGLDRLPRLVLAVRLAAAAGDVQYPVPALDQSRHQIGADVPAAADDDHTAHPASSSSY